jgi:predicted nucleotidyltransferase
MQTPASEAKPPLTPEEVKQIVARLRLSLQPRRILVFGSYARGDWQPGSDLDLFVEMETDLPPHQRRLLARRAMGRKICPVDVLVYTPAEVADRRESLGSIIPTILREGREVA